MVEHSIKQRSRGFSMVELLVAVLVMGVGVLGVTGLQMVSLQNNRDALLRSEALQLAYDMMDRIRINPPATAYDGVGFDTDPSAPADCYAGNCSSAQMAVFDVAVWKCALGEYNELATCTGLDADILPAATDQPGLPDGEGSIAVDANGLVTINVRWTGFGGDTETLTIQSQG